jgi:hypothetical protein
MTRRDGMAIIEMVNYKDARMEPAPLSFSRSESDPAFNIPSIEQWLGACPKANELGHH